MKVQKKVIDGLIKNLEELQDTQDDTQKKESTIDVIRRKMKQLTASEESLNNLLADEELVQAMNESADLL